MLRPTHLCNLLVEPGAHPRGQAHLSAASGLVRVGGRLYLVADDEHHLGTVAADGAGWVRLHRLLAGDLPADKGKPDSHLKEEFLNMLDEPQLQLALVRVSGQG